MSIKRDHSLNLQNGHISDLAFNYEPLCKAISNYDHEGAIIEDSEIIDAANMFVGCMEGITNTEVISSKIVINDFLNRL